MIPPKNHGKHPGGRPSKYDPSYPNKLLTFIKRGGPRIFKALVVSEGNNQGSTVVDHPIGKLPGRFEGFCRLVGISAETFSNWQTAYPEFLEAYKKAKQIQLEQLMQGMTAGTYQVAATIFDLKNNHGYRDRQPDEQPNVNVHVSIATIDGMKQVAAHRANRLATVLPPVNGNGDPQS